MTLIPDHRIFVLFVPGTGHLKEIKPKLLQSYRVWNVLDLGKLLSFAGVLWLKPKPAAAERTCRF